MQSRLQKAEWLADRLGISLARAYELIRSATVPSVKVGRQVRVDPEQIETWVRSGGQSLPGGWRREA